MSTVYISYNDCETIRARIALSLGGLLSFMIRNAFLYTNQHVWAKILIEGVLHRRSHSIPLIENPVFVLLVLVYGEFTQNTLMSKTSIFDDT